MSTGWFPIVSYRGGGAFVVAASVRYILAPVELGRNPKHPKRTLNLLLDKRSVRNDNASPLARASTTAIARRSRFPRV